MSQARKCNVVGFFVFSSILFLLLRTNYYTSSNLHIQEKYVCRFRNVNRIFRILMCSEMHFFIENCISPKIEKLVQNSSSSSRRNKFSFKKCQEWYEEFVEMDTRNWKNKINLEKQRNNKCNVPL